MKKCDDATTTNPSIGYNNNWSISDLGPSDAPQRNEDDRFTHEPQQPRDTFRFGCPTSLMDADDESDGTDCVANVYRNSLEENRRNSIIDEAILGDEAEYKEQEMYGGYRADYITPDELFKLMIDSEQGRFDDIEEPGTTITREPQPPLATPTTTGVRIMKDAASDKDSVRSWMCRDCNSAHFTQTYRLDNGYFYRCPRTGSEQHYRFNEQGRVYPVDAPESLASDGSGVVEEADNTPAIVTEETEVVDLLWGQKVSMNLFSWYTEVWAEDGSFFRIFTIKGEPFSEMFIVHVFKDHNSFPRLFNCGYDYEPGFWHQAAGDLETDVEKLVELYQHDCRAREALLTKNYGSGVSPETLAGATPADSFGALLDPQFHDSTLERHFRNSEARKYEDTYSVTEEEDVMQFDKSVPEPRCSLYCGMSTVNFDSGTLDCVEAGDIMVLKAEEYFASQRLSRRQQWWHRNKVSICLLLLVFLFLLFGWIISGYIFPSAK